MHTQIYMTVIYADLLHVANFNFVYKYAKVAVCMSYIIAYKQTTVAQMQLLMRI